MEKIFEFVLYRIYKFGATITSWTVKGQELIFTSPKVSVLIG